MVLSRRSHIVSDPPSDTSADGAGIGRGGSSSQPMPAPSDAGAEDGSLGWRAGDTPTPRSVRLLRLLVDLYEAVRNLGPIGATRNAQAALMELQRDREDVATAGMLTERAAKNAAS